MVTAEVKWLGLAQIVLKSDERKRGFSPPFLSRFVPNSCILWAIDIYYKSNPRVEKLFNITAVSFMTRLTAVISMVETLPSGYYITL